MTFWHLIQASAGTNGWQNPSLESNTTGWAGTVSATAAREAGTAAFGAWAAKVTPNAAANSGVTYGTVLVPDIGTHTVSAYIYGGSGSVYSIGLKGVGAGAAFILGSVAGTTGGTWHRYTMTYGDSGAAANRLFAVVKRSAGNDPFFVDGVQIEGGSVATTYMDGDQEGVAWTGVPHASSSSRSGTARAGGRVVSLDSLGLTVLEQGGGGMPPVANITQEYAIADGALWQRQRATARALTLTSLMSGTTWPGLHAIRQTVIDAVKINATPNPQPVRFLYTGAGGTAVLDAYYDGGMQFETRRGFSETLGLRFLATDPYWTATTDAGTALVAQTTFGSANYIMQRSPTGVWGTMGPNGTSVFANTGGVYGVESIYAAPSGTVFLGGGFGSVAGTAARGIVMWYPNEQRYGTLAGTLDGGGNTGAPIVFDMFLAPFGTLYVGGDFFTAVGTRSRGLTQYNGAWGSMVGGTVAGNVAALAYNPNGTLFFGGVFQTTTSGSALHAAFWTGAAYGSLPGGTLNSFVNDVVYGPDGTLYLAGFFAALSGTISPGFTKWAGGTYSPIGSGVSVVAGANGAYDIQINTDGLMYLAGDFGPTSSAGSYLAVSNGVSVSSVANGVNNAAYAVGRDDRGFVYVGGWFDASGGQALNSGVAFYNGASIIPLDINLSVGVNKEVQAFGFGADRTLYVGGRFFGQGTAAAVTTIVNNAAAAAYPVLVLRNNAGTAARIYQLVNTSTGDGVYFNLTILPGETLTMDLRNNKKTLTSTTRGNLLGAVTPGSNLTSWQLAPGTNYVSFFAGTSGVEASFYYRPRAWSQDDPL